MVAALTFPLSLAEFFDDIPRQAMPFDLSEATEISVTAAGDTLSADYGERVWTGGVTLAPRNHAEARRVEAKLRVLRQAGRSFMVYDVAAAYPAADPDGSILGASTPVIDTLNADNRRLRVSGLPAGYVLTGGDFLAFTYGSPARYALHQIVTGIVADGAGLTGWFEVVPFIQPGAAVSAAVTLIRASCKAVIVPGTTTPGTRERNRTGGVTFQFRQTFR